MSACARPVASQFIPACALVLWASQSKTCFVDCDYIYYNTVIYIYVYIFIYELCTADQSWHYNKTTTHATNKLLTIPILSRVAYLVHRWSARNYIRNPLSHIEWQCAPRVHIPPAWVQLHRTSQAFIACMHCPRWHKKLKIRLLKERARDQTTT